MHLLRFEVLLSELQNPNFGRSASGAERRILISSIYHFPSKPSYLEIITCRESPDPLVSMKATLLLYIASY